MSGLGALPSQLIKQISNLKQITSLEKPLKDKAIQPASADLSVDSWGYCVKSTFLPKESEKVADVVKKYQLFPVDLSNGFVLNTGSTYVFKLNERLNLSEDIFAYTSPKSSTGRVNLWVRTLADNVARLDRIPAGYKGPLYVMVSPKSWPVILKKNESLNQIRFFKSEVNLSDFELKLLHQEIGLLYDKNGKKIETNGFISDNGILLTADLQQKVIAYQAKGTVNILDLAKRNYYSLEDFFRPIYGSKDAELILEQGSFYLLSSYEYVRVPIDYSAEMVAYDISSGEFRSHYAGFFDPGFGYGKNGETKGRPAVLEIFPHENVILRHRQPVCKMIYEQMAVRPDRVYGVDERIGSHYYTQSGIKTSKHFKSLKESSK
jgi:dCTP deaminase